MLLASDWPQYLKQVQSEHTHAEETLVFLSLFLLPPTFYSFLLLYKPIIAHLCVSLYPTFSCTVDTIVYSIKGKQRQSSLPFSHFFEFLINEIIVFPCLINSYSAVYKFSTFHGKLGQVPWISQKGILCVNVCHDFY